jgi:hypothetical protein
MDERLCIRDAAGRIQNYDKIGLSAWQGAAMTYEAHRQDEGEHEIEQLKAANAALMKRIERLEQRSILRH